MRPSRKTKRKKIQEIYEKVEEMYARIETLNRQIRDVLDLAQNVQDMERERKEEHFAYLMRKSNVFFEREDTGIIELIPTGNVIRVFRSRTRYDRNSPVPIVRVALFQEAAPIQNEDLTYPPRYGILRYDDVHHQPQVRRAFLKVFRLSTIPWVHDRSVEILEASVPPYTLFDEIGSVLLDRGYEVFIHYAQPSLVEEGAVESEDDSEDD